MSKLSLREIAQSQLDSTPVIDGQLIVCLDTGNAYRDTATAHVKIGSDLEVVSDLPLAPLAEKLYYLKPDKLYVFLGGNWTLLNDKTIDLDESIAKLPAGSSTVLNDDVEIITQDTDITQPHYYRRKLVVIWEYIKTKAQDFFAAKNHKHGKADITDFPTSMPASDVYPWAKAATKPSYTKAEVGLGEVDNTADADKTVKRATTARTADSANSVAWENVKDKPTTFPVEAHTHDERYYTEAEIDEKLSSKVNNNEAGANGLLSKLSVFTATPTDDTYFMRQDIAGTNQFGRVKFSTIWNYIKGKADGVYQPKGSYSASGHTHDDRYYTEAEIDGKLYSKVGFNKVSAALVAQPGNNPYVGNVEGEDVGIGEGSYYSVINLGSYSGGNYRSQIAVPYQNSITDSNMYIRTANNATWRPWRKIIHSGNIGDQTVAKAATADTANVLSGFAVNRSSQTWGVQTGTFVHGEGDSTGGDFAFRRDCPTGGQLSMVIDGRFYQNGGQYRVLDTSDEPNLNVNSANYINDVGDHRTLSFAYSKDGLAYGSYSWLAGWNGSELRAVHKSQFAIAGHSHSFINSVGVKNAQTGRNQIYGNVYSYNSNASAHTGMPTTYTSTIGFGQGASGTVEICGEWTGGKGLWSRALRDCCDDWYGWQRIYTENYHPSADVANKANSADYLNFTAGNEINFTGTPTNNTVYFGYRNSTINDYRFCNGSGGLTKVTAASFDGKATNAGTADSATTSNGVKDYNDGNRTIKIGYAGAGLNTSNLTHIAGYTDNGTKIKDVSKDVLTSWIGLGNYLPLSGGLVTGQIQKNTGGSWIGDRDRAVVRSHYPGDWSYGAVAAMATKNGYWTMGNLGGNESLIFNYSPDSNYSAGKNETSQVYLPAQAGTIITSATIGNQTVNTATYSTYVKDIGNSSNTTFAYSKNGMSYGDYIWLAGWNGYELRAVHKSQFATAEQGVTASGKTGAGIYYVRFGNGTQMCWGFYKESDHSGSTSFPVAFNNSQYSLSLTVTVSSNNAPYITGRSTTSFSYARHGTSYNDVQWIAVGTWK